MINAPKEPSIPEWFNFIQNSFAAEYQEAACAFVSKLIEKDARVIFDIVHLSKLTGFAVSALNAMVNNTPSFYRRFDIPKRSGGLRSICSPYPSLLDLQRWIAGNCLNGAAPSEAAHGFVSGRSVASNAQPHLGARCVLRLDMQDFFPTITLRRVIGVFQSIGYDNSLSYSLARLCTLDGSLPQGAASSPVISNRILRRLDRRLIASAKQAGLQYTRYADDLTFSGEEISLTFPAFVESIIKDEGFAINPAKTRLMRGSSRKIVTGISIGSGRPKLPRNKRRQLRAEAFWVARRGVLAHVRTRNIRDPKYLERLLGRVAFWLMVEPESSEAKEFHAILSQMLSDRSPSANTSLL